MDEGIDAERPVRADQAGGAPLQEIEARPPHQRSVGENPQVFAALVGFFAHRGWIWTTPLTGPGDLRSRNRPDRSGATHPPVRAALRIKAQKRRIRQVLQPTMAKRSRRSRSARRRNRRYIGMLVLFVALIGGWSWFWHYAAGKAEVAIAGWRAREAKAGRIYSCGSQSIGGYPFRIEVDCDNASALFRSNQPPVEIKTSRHADRRADLSAEPADHRIPGSAHHRRSGQSADHRRQLEARPVERARHADGAAARVAGVRRPGRSTASAAANARPCCRPSASKFTAASSKAR